ncbi:MAG TPA: ASPIC/UnbV domain-containing protein, partial [candidate division Zixibacteria bacterium]|nr:ASPIC/UnbV domain-containing protein [candidate division Zixibacteria bacterium]
IETDYRLYRNLAIGTGANNWLTIRLDGEGGSFSRDAIGTRVYLSTDDGQTQMQEVKSGSSIGAGNDLALHFGLGAADVTSVLVRWPDGITETLTDVPVNRIWELSYLPADMALSPTSISSNQGVNTVISRTLNLSSTGGRDVIWRIEEDGRTVSGESAPCDTTSDIPWLDVLPSSGATVSGQTSRVEAAFDSTGLLAGAYTGYLCVLSNDPNEPLVIVDVEMIVEPPTDVNLSSFSAAKQIGILPVLLGFLLVLSLAGIRSRFNR